MAELIGETEVLCPDCRTPHPARQLHEAGKIVGEVDCPVAPWRTTLSDNAELFLQFRRQAGYDPQFRAPAKRPYYFHYLSITDDCNCRCPVCFTAAGPGHHRTALSLDAAQQAAETARANGAKTVVFIGGEPTIHPQLFELIATFRRVGLKVWIASNGLRLAEEPELAGRLKQSGVDKICLQFDSFDSDTHQAIRGHQQIATKRDAAHAISTAGLTLGLVCTVTPHNLAELGAFCRTALAWPQPPTTIAIQAAAESGRLTTDNDAPICREQIVASLIDGDAVDGLAGHHFWPIPIVRPLNIFVHADCSANTVAVITPTATTPLSTYLDVDRLFALVGRLPADMARPVLATRLGLAFLACLRRPAPGLLLRHLWARLRGKPGIRLCFIGTGAFLRRDFHDLARIERCASGVIAGRHCDSMCRYFSQKPFTAVQPALAKEGT